MSLYKRGETWWVYFVHDGQRIRESTHTSDDKQAKIIHDEFKVSLKTRKESGKTLADALKIWLKKSERTASEKSAIRTLLKYYPSRPLSEINGHDIEDALSSKKPATYNRIANNVRAALRMAHDRKWCDEIKIPSKEVKNTKLRFLTQEEWGRLEKELAPHVKPMAQFAISTGLRQSNVFNLMWNSIDLNRGIAWVDSTEAKAGKAIPVPLSKYAQEVIKSQIGKHDQYVFTFEGEKVGSVKTSWNKSLIRANIDVVKVKNKLGEEVSKSTFRWHDLRHTWASWHIMHGTPIAVLKELGGWHDMDMVMKYAHLSPDHLMKYADNAVAINDI